jgi:hypothetical protein
VLDNYEANTNYFPLKWHDGINPHKHLSRKRGIEGVPPSAAINEYRLKNGVVIDKDSSFGGNRKRERENNRRKIKKGSLLLIIINKDKASVR